tara:strand:+ start:7413 stop:7655 length:243 start_codon:yes stop_codon:yes gene_type:complete
MSKTIEFIKPVFDIDKYFKVADHLLHSDNIELEELGRTMRKVYANNMVETEYKEVEQPKQYTEEQYKKLFSCECQTGVCD